MFQLIVFLKPDFNSFALSWVDKVTTGKYSFVSVIGNVVVFVSLDVFCINTYFSEQVNMGLIAQLDKGISRVFQKLLIHFNGTVISTPFLPLAASVLLVIFYSNLDETLSLAVDKSVTMLASVKAGSFL